MVCVFFPLRQTRFSPPVSAQDWNVAPQSRESCHFKSFRAEMDCGIFGTAPCAATFKFCLWWLLPLWKICTSEQRSNPLWHSIRLLGLYGTLWWFIKIPISNWVVWSPIYNRVLVTAQIKLTIFHKAKGGGQTKKQTAQVSSKNLLIRMFGETVLVVYIFRVPTVGVPGLSPQVSFCHCGIWQEFCW